MDILKSFDKVLVDMYVFSKAKKDVTLFNNGKITIELFDLNFTISYNDNNERLVVEVAKGKYNKSYYYFNINVLQHLYPTPYLQLVHIIGKSMEYFVNEEATNLKIKEGLKDGN